MPVPAITGADRAAPPIRLSVRRDKSPFPIPVGQWFAGALSASVGRRPPSVVLIADDTYDTRELYGMYFANQGFRVLTACNGEEAVHIALGERPDVIVMDLSMPQLDGIAAIRRLKEDPRTRRTRVILLTGYPYSAIQRGGLNGGADVFLTKPCLPEDLEQHVRNLLEIGPGGR